MAIPPVVISFEARFAQFQASLDQIARSSRRTVGQIESSFRGLRSIGGVLASAFGAHQLVRFSSAIITAAEELNTINERTGVAVEELAGLQFAAQQTGTSTEALAKGIKELDRSIVEMGAGADKASAKLFQQLGLSDLARGASSGTEALLRLADVFPQLTAAQREFVAGKLGKSFFELIPALSGGRKALEDFIKEGQRLNPITKEMAKNADDFNDNLTKIGVGLKGILLPAFLPALQAFNQFIDKVNEASRAAGGLFKLLQAGVSIADINKGADKIAELEKKISDVTKRRETLEKFGGIGKFISGEEQHTEDFLRRQLDILKNAQSARERARDLEAGGDPAKPKSKPIKLDLGTEDATKTAKALLDKSLSDVENAINAEKDLLSDRVQIISAYYESDFLSAERFFGARSDAIEESVSKTIALYDKEIAALRDFSRSADPKEQIEASTKIVDLIAKKQKAQADAAQQGIASFLEETKAAQEYIDKLNEISAELSEQEGDLRRAAELRFATSNRQITRQAIGAGDERALGDIADLRKFTLAQAELNELKEKAEKINANLATQERRIEIERQFGASTELDALSKTSDARQDAVRQLEAIVISYEAVAAASGNQKLIQDAAGLRTSLEELAAQSDLVAKKFQAVFDDSLADFFVDTLTGTKDVSEAFKDMVNSILRDIARIFVEKTISGPIARGLAQGFSGMFHTGGIVGEASSGRMAPLSTFANVPRYHAGGVAGEVPIFATAGEGIFTPEQMKRLGPAGGITVNVHPQPGETAQVRERQDGQGNMNIDVIIERIESKLGANISRGRGISPILERQFGLSRVPGSVR